MASKRGQKQRPQYSIAISARIAKGKYKKGPSFGLWTADGDGPMARGTIKEDWLEEVVDFLSAAQEKEQAVSVALFENDNET